MNFLNKEEQILQHFLKNKLFSYDESLYYREFLKIFYPNLFVDVKKVDSGFYKIEVLAYNINLYDFNNSYTDIDTYSMCV